MWCAVRSREKSRWKIRAPREGGHKSVVTFHFVYGRRTAATKACIVRRFTGCLRITGESFTVHYIQKYLELISLDFVPPSRILEPSTRRPSANLSAETFDVQKLADLATPKRKASPGMTHLCFHHGISFLVAISEKEDSKNAKRLYFQEQTEHT